MKLITIFDSGDFSDGGGLLCAIDNGYLIFSNTISLNY